LRRIGDIVAGADDIVDFIPSECQFNRDHGEDHPNQIAEAEEVKEKVQLFMGEPSFIDDTFEYWLCLVQNVLEVVYPLCSGSQEHTCKIYRRACRHQDVEVPNATVYSKLGEEEGA